MKEEIIKRIQKLEKWRKKFDRYDQPPYEEEKENEKRLEILRDLLDALYG